MDGWRGKGKGEWMSGCWNGERMDGCTDGWMKGNDCANKWIES